MSRGRSVCREAAGANSRSPRDGAFIEKIGTYDPLLKSDDPKRFTLDVSTEGNAEVLNLTPQLAEHLRDLKGDGIVHCFVVGSTAALSNGAKVTTAALDFGYDSPSAYIAAFKRHFGMTPRQFARQR